MGSGTLDWTGWCEETASSTALEVASVIRTNYVIPPTSSSTVTSNGPTSTTTTTDLNATNRLSTAQANDLIRRFVEVFARKLESEILHKGADSSSEPTTTAATTTTTANPTAQNTSSSSYDFPANSSSAAAYSQRSSTRNSAEANSLPPQVPLPNGEPPHSNGFHHNVLSKQHHNSSAQPPPGRSAGVHELENGPPSHQTPSRKPFYRRYHNKTIFKLKKLADI